MNDYSQTLKTLEKALKEHYLPVWNNLLGIKPSAILSKIHKEKLTANEIVGVAPVGLSGGFGFGEENEATPIAGGMMHEKFKSRSKDMYANIGISAKAVKLGSGNGAVVNSLKEEIDGAYNAANWNVGRALLGNGTGKLAKVATAQTGATEKFKVTSYKYLIEGLIIDVYNEDGTKIDSKKRIIGIDRRPDGDGLYTVTLATASSVAYPENAFITVQNSYNREITGLGAIFDDSIDVLYGVKKSENPIIRPIVDDAEGSISDSIITNILRRSGDETGGNVDMILVGNKAYDAYAEYLRETNRRVEANKTLEGGFKAIKFDFGDREVDIVNDKFVPDYEMWGIDSSRIKLRWTDWFFADLQNGGIFNLMENSSIYRALLCNYGELMSETPGSSIRLFNVGGRPNA